MSCFPIRWAPSQVRPEYILRCSASVWESKDHLPRARVLAGPASSTTIAVNAVADPPSSSCRNFIGNRVELRHAKRISLLMQSRSVYCRCREAHLHRATVSRIRTLAKERAEDDVVQVKVAVGPIRRCSEKTFPFKRILGPSSVLVVVTLAKPMGIIFEPRAVTGIKKQRVVVAELVPGSYADRASRVAQMFHGVDTTRNGSKVIVGGDVKPGDILRATTTVGVLVDFFGLRRPQREMWLYETDGRPWNEIMAALGASFVADGPLTLVLERKC